MCKFESDRVRIILKNNGIQFFYHFTDRKNIESIKKYEGLYSWFYLKSHDIPIPNQGGDDISENLDRRHGLQDFVRLSFCKDHPMSYRKKQAGSDIVVLKISVDVATFETTLFSDMNATDSRHTHSPDLATLQKVNFAATQREYVRSDDPEFKVLQAEVMVKTFLPARYIVNLNNF